jgi:hypothetical protein
MVRSTVLAALLFALLLSPTRRLAQDEKPVLPNAIEMRECLILPAVGSAGRSPVHVDALEAQIVAGKFKTPKAGDKVKDRNSDEKVWYKAVSDENGWFAHEDYAGAYGFWSVDSAAETIAILNARGHSSCYANGEPHMGDMYDTGNVRIPVRLRKGANEFLFTMGRGRVKASLELRKPDAPALMIGQDWTLPDIVPGSVGFIPMGSVNVLNCSTKPVTAACVVSGDLN